ncbi:MAG TPA: 4-hydroxy-3-methylbut-2-enyl diphosphate reductase [Magnetospirillum sp.]|jgi:4-hydroxy-3-methylbut-2-enyl diphosphate reductase|nr:4-hydroxy-3-methylbut-2-enyl diphosphate reductase [Magnetospirillum sp.]
MRVYLARPRGFCAGVERAIEIVERALARFGPPIYVRHEIVHNVHVVRSLKEKGVVFVDELDQVPADAPMTIFSAHGVSKAVEDEARARGLQVIDATCPLVSKVHIEGRRYAKAGCEVVLIGHAGHAEVQGTVGQISGKVHVVATVADVERLEVADPEKLAYITQTTLSLDDTRAVVDALTRRFPAIVGPDINDICYATQNRQRAVRHLAGMVDAIVVIGAKNSSNSNRLKEIAADCGVPAYLIDDAGGLDPAWLKGVTAIGVTAGASAPEHLVAELIAALDRLSGGIDLREVAGIEEHVAFRLPRELA